MTTLAPELLESLETWEELSDCARMVAADLDTGRFALGDVANRCARVYGQDSIGKLADEIRVAKRQTLYEYAKVAARFESSARAEYLDAGLTFSHFRTALRAGDDAELFLARAADEGWPVAELARQIAAAKGERVPPRKVFEGLGIVCENWPGEGWHIVLEGDCGALAAGLRVTVKLWTEAADG